MRSNTNRISGTRFSVCFLFLALFAGLSKAQSFWSLEAGIGAGLVKCYPEIGLVRYLPHGSIRLYGGGGLLKEMTQKQDQSAALVDPGVYLYSPKSLFLGGITGMDYRRYIAMGPKHEVPRGFYFGVGVSTTGLTNYKPKRSPPSEPEYQSMYQEKKYFGSFSPDISFGYQNVIPSSRFLIDVYGSVSCYCSYNLGSLGGNDDFLGRSFALHISVGNLYRKIPVRPCPGPL